LLRSACAAAIRFSAKLAFEATRRINPQLTQVRIAVEEAASRLSYRAVLKPTAGILLTQR
jgi:hypothetical protein